MKTFLKQQIDTVLLMKSASVALCLLLLGCDPAKTYPKTDGPNSNPLKGWNGSWWNTENDYYAEHATVGFQYISWKDFEPQDGQYDFEKIERDILSRPGSKNKHLQLQFYVDWCCAYDPNNPAALNDNYNGPQWLLDKVGETISPDGKRRATNYNNPLFIAEMNEAVQALTDYFKNDERVFILQSGVVGWWGEWHTFYQMDDATIQQLVEDGLLDSPDAPEVDALYMSPTDETKQAVFSAYLNNIGPHLIQARYPDDTVSVSTPGVGYTNGFFAPVDHGNDFNTHIENGELWKNGPIGGEWPPGESPDAWKLFFTTDTGFDYIKTGHYSHVASPSFKDLNCFVLDFQPSCNVPYPDPNPELHRQTWEANQEYSERFMQMHRLMGYNFQIDSAVFPNEIPKTDELRIQLKGKNIGLAPMYKDWDVQYALLDSNNNPVKTFEVTYDTTDILPEAAFNFDHIGTLDTVTTGTYQVAVRIIQPGADSPKAEQWRLDNRNTYILFANELSVIDGSWADDHALNGGWSVLGDIEVK